MTRVGVPALRSGYSRLPSTAVLRLAAIAGTLLVAGCSTPWSSRLEHQRGESLVFIGEEPSTLAFAPARNRPVHLRSKYLPGPATITYEENRDYRVDYARGTIARLPGSRLPDFRTNVLFGQPEFDHTKFPGYGNKAFFAYADYDLAVACRWPVQPPHSDRLRATRAKLRAGDAVKIVAFGDSIMRGGEASEDGLVFWRRWADDLQRKYPRARVSTVNAATGGDNTTRGLQRLQRKVLDEKPDLVLIGFGMNDHNVRGVPRPEFERQLREMITRIREAAKVEVIVLSTFPPNARWVHGSHRMEEYAAATARVAAEAECAYGDVFNNWRLMTARKRPEDILANNINHPNDFGHWIYYRVLVALEL